MKRGQCYCDIMIGEHCRDGCAMDPDDPDNWQSEAEDKETTDNERDDHEGWPVVDWGEYACEFGDFMGE